MNEKVSTLLYKPIYMGAEFASSRCYNKYRNLYLYSSYRQRSQRSEQGNEVRMCVHFVYHCVMK